MVDWVTTEPQGLAEPLLYQDAASTFAGWRAVTYTITPKTGWGVLSHLEAGDFHRPGDAPVVYALGQSPIPAGSNASIGVYNRAMIQGNYLGNAWDTETIATPSSLPEGWSEQSIGGRKIAVGGADYMTPEAAARAGQDFTPADSQITAFGMLKGLSRWGMLFFDMVPEGIDALIRAGNAVGAGEMSPLEATGGILGFGSAADELGIPLFRYLQSAAHGERLNMGTGWFAQGEVADDIAQALARYDQETHGIVVNEPGGMEIMGRQMFGEAPVYEGGLTQADFDRERELQGGRVLVEGLGGKTFEAKNLKEWKFLRDNVGRAALLQSLSGTSLEQQQLGTPHGSFQEQIFDEAAVTRRGQTGSYFSASLGRTLAAVPFEPETMPFHALSAPLDLGKQLVDLNILGVAARGAKVINKANRFVGLSGEAGELADGTRTLLNVVEGADLDAVPLAVGDLVAGRINAPMAVNSLARLADEPLNAANQTVSTLRSQGWKLGEAAGRNVTEAGIDALIDRAAKGDWAATKWAENVLRSTLDPDMNVNVALENLAAVSGREGVSLTKGRYGAAQVSEDVFAQAADQVARLEDLLTNRKASVVRDPQTGEAMLTFDADLGHAAYTLEKVTGAVAMSKGSRAGAAQRVVAAMDEYEATLDRLFEIEEETTGIVLRKEARAQARLERLNSVSSWAGGGRTFYHGSKEPLGDLGELGAGGQSFGNLYGPGLYSTDNVAISASPGYGGTASGDVTKLTWTGKDAPRIFDLEAEVPETAAVMASALRTLTEWMAATVSPVFLRPESYLPRLTGALDELATRTPRSSAGKRLHDLAEELGIEDVTPGGLIQWLANELVAESHVVADDGLLVLNKAIRDLGFDAMRHTGGRIMGTQAHEVMVWLRPELLKKTPVGKRTHEILIGKGVSATRESAQEAAMARWEKATVDARQAFDEAIDSGLLDDLLSKDKNLDFPSTVSDWDKLRKLARDSDEVAETARRQMAQGLLNERWITRRQAEKLLGDNDAATSDIDNLIRVLRRSDGEGLITRGASSVKPQLPPERIATILSGTGSMGADLVKSLIAATTHAEVRAILGPTIEWSGKVPAPILRAFKDATTEGEIIDAFMRLGAGQQIIAQKIGLLGNAARFGSFSTVAGGVGGGIAGGTMEAEADGGFGDIVGGVLTGAVLGAFAGSAVGGAVGGFSGKTTRSIDSVADAMDLMLSGTRAATTDLIRATGMPMTRAQAGLGVPQQMAYAFGHSPLGRRLARTAGTNINLNDPTDFYYKLTDYVRSLAFRTDEVVEEYQRGAGKTRELTRLVRSSYKTADEFAQAQADLLTAGYGLNRVWSMDEVMDRAADMVANNPADGYRILHDFAKVADAVLENAGMHPNYRHLLTNFAKQTQDEFLGTLDAMARPSAYAQMAVNGRVVDTSKGARLESEMWNGRISLPPPEKVNRAVNSLDMLGRTVTAITGKGAAAQAMRNLRRLAGGESWMKITPELEYNIAVRTMRALTGTLWAPVVLLGRPFSFLSRVLGEDQFRMAASGLDNMFTHPLDYFAAVMANWKVWRKRGALRGVASRSIIPDEIFTKKGAFDPDALDGMSEWDLAEEVRSSLGLYDRTQAAHNRVFGVSSWTTIEKGQPLYLDGLATEFRQLVADPMVRRMARSTSDDPITDTLNWLLNTSEGHRVAHGWAKQFETPAIAAEFMEPENLKAFLADQYARMHLKTGGDWIFKNNDGVIINSLGNVVDKSQAAARGWDALGPGYTIVRKGDSDLLDVVGHGRMNVAVKRDEAGKIIETVAGRKGTKLIEDPETGVEFTQEALRVMDNITERKWRAIKDLLGEKNDAWRSRELRGGADPITSMGFPAKVKGTRANPNARGWTSVIDLWGDGIDRFYDWLLGRPTRIFSRQPVIGAHYWERIGMMYPSMDEKLQAAYRGIAEKEGTWRQVRAIAGAYEDAGAAARGTLTEMGIADINAKAYAVERTRDILFDLHRQRNFVDAFRVVAPFMGPFVEAMEAWARVIKENPVTVWRRGGQLVDHLWNTSGIGSPTTDTPFSAVTGEFYVDPETGDEMFIYPLIGRMVPGWMNKSLADGVPADPLGGRARGLNIMFGTENMTAGEGPEFAGIPLAAANMGTGPMLQLAVAPFLKDREGAAAEVYEWLFPFGTPDNPTALLPYNLRKWAEGNLGEGSQRDLVAHTTAQFGVMVTSGEIGVGPGYAHDLSEPGGVEAAMEVARERAIAANWYEALARSILPTVATPDILAALPQEGAERVMTLQALADEARRLMDFEGEGTSDWVTYEDGYRVSTEGDWEVTTEYLNKKYGYDMFSAEFLSLPLNNRPYPLSFTKSGLAWVQAHPEVMSRLKVTGSFLMPNYAGIEADEEYSYEAFEAALARGDASFYRLDEIREQVESRLLKMELSQVKRQADQMFGTDDVLAEIEDDTERVSLREQKAAWVSNQSERAKARYDAGELPESEQTKVFGELMGWDEITWDDYNLAPEEMATVNAVLWYLNARDAAISLIQPGVNSLDDKGTSEADQAVVQAARADLAAIVEAQLSLAAENNVDMGNFAYLYEKYLFPEISGTDEFDALAALATLRQQDLGLDEAIPELIGTGTNG